MSGRQLAVDRSVILDLNRHLRYTAEQDQVEVSSEPARAARPDASFLIEAVSNAAVSISSRDERIRQLERQHHEIEDLVDRMKSKLGELLRLQQTTDALAKSEKERADRAEARSHQLQSRVEDLEGDLDSALADLHRIADVITGSLLTPDRR